MAYVVLLVIGGFVWYVLEPHERAKVLQSVAGVFHRAGRAAAARANRHREPDAFETALRTRVRWVVATPAIAAAMGLVFVAMAGDPGAISSPDTLLAWGASFGPLTSNGEWDRLARSMFVHGGLLHLLVNLAALVQIGLVLERLTGTLTFAAVYVLSGIFAGLVSLTASPVDISLGASGAIAGLYGLLCVAAVRGWIRRSAASIPFAVIRRLTPVAMVFVLYNWISSSLHTGAEVAGALTGLACGAALVRDPASPRPRLARVAAAAAAGAAMAVVWALPLRGMTDVVPEMHRLATVEDRMAAAYEKAVAQFRLGALSSAQLAQFIQRTIVPELNAAKARIGALDKVPAPQQALVASAQEYLRLRDESWRLRTEALRTSRMAALRDADRAERASLEALARTRRELEPEP